MITLFEVESVGCKFTVVVREDGYHTRLFGVSAINAACVIQATGQRVTVLPPVSEAEYEAERARNG